MSEATDSPPLPWRRHFFRWGGIAVVALTLTALFFRIPASPSSERDLSYEMLLDLSFRPAAPATTSAHTLDGPLAPLQQPVYVGRSIWRVMVWQLGANFLMCAIVVAAAFRLSTPRAWSALLLFCVFGLWETSAIPWVTILVLAGWTASIENRIGWVLGGIGLGILASTSASHFWLAVTAQVLLASVRFNRAPYALGGFIAGFGGTWLVLGQSLSRLGQWVWFGVSSAWTPSFESLPAAVTKASGAAGVALVSWMALVWLLRSKLRTQKLTGVNVLLTTGGMFLSWKLTALQPAGTPLLFFATILFGGIVLLSLAPKSAAAILTLGVVGTAIAEPASAADPVGLINRRILSNAGELAHLPNLRERLRQNFKGYAGGLAMPRIRGVLTAEPAGIIGDRAMPAILNEFRVTPSMSFGTEFVRDDTAARRNAEAILAPDTPLFLLESNDRISDLLPPLRDGPARLAMFRAYEFLFNEQGLSLWKKRTQRINWEPRLVGEGVVPFGTGIHLPRDGEAYWLELECRPNWLGRALDLLKPLREPFLRIVDTDGNEVRYTLAWRLARAGFLVAPFFRGDIDALRFQDGETLRKASHVVVDLPVSGHSLWRSEIRYRVYQLPHLSPGRDLNLIAPIKQQFSAINRLPSAVAAPFAPIPALESEKPVVFMHPNSIFEIVALTQDSAIKGTVGIAAGAYADPGPNVTDGVEFSIDFLPATGRRVTLFRRYLNPAKILGDRGAQPFEVAIPSSTGGRLLFHTSNLPEKSSAFDWSYWGEIELK